MDTVHTRMHTHYSRERERPAGIVNEHTKLNYSACWLWEIGLDYSILNIINKPTEPFQQTDLLWYIYMLQMASHK